MFFLIENGNRDLFDTLRNRGIEYNEEKKAQIKTKMSFSSTISWVCIAIIGVCGVFIIPLFGRIQNRILLLMKILFSIENEKK